MAKIKWVGIVTSAIAAGHYSDCFLLDHAADI